MNTVKVIVPMTEETIDLIETYSNRTGLPEDLIIQMMIQRAIILEEWGA